MKSNVCAPVAPVTSFDTRSVRSGEFVNAAVPLAPARETVVDVPTTPLAVVAQPSPGEASVTTHESPSAMPLNPMASPSASTNDALSLVNVTPDDVVFAAERGVVQSTVKAKLPAPSGWTSFVTTSDRVIGAPGALPPVTYMVRPPPFTCTVNQRAPPAVYAGFAAKNAATSTTTGSVGDDDE